MPNYTHNYLTVQGVPEALRYFYERNRISDIDAKFMGFHGEQPISFEKCVSREIDTVFANYINRNYIVKSYSEVGFFKNLNKSENNVDDWDLMVSIWGTKWDAIDPKVDLTKIDNEKKVVYNFDTAWCFPENWLITISKMFHYLTFEIKFTNEDDGHDQTYIYQYKNGKKIEIEQFSGILKCINEFGGVEKIVETMITYCNDENIMITDYSSENQEKIYWLTYAKSYIEKNSHEKDYEFELLCNIHDEINDLFEKYNFHLSLYINKELCIAFAEKVKSM